MKRSLLRGMIAALFIVLGALYANAQSMTVTGTVTDENGAALVGATVIEKNTTNGVVTNGEGKYSIPVKSGAILQFSYLGYESAEHKVTGPVLNVTMKPSAEALEEAVVVSGMHSIDKRVFTGSSQRIRGSRSAQAVSYFYDMDAYGGTEEYGHINENRFINVDKDPLSTFALEVDGASYSNVRRMLNRGEFPDPDAVRAEEFINYFSYDYPEPTGGDPVAISYEVGPCPWNAEHKLVQIGIKAKNIPAADLPPANFVFLIDVSGSMYGPTRLGLVQSSLKLLVNNLRDEDRVAIVTYSGAAGLALPSTPGSDKQKIRDALDNLTAGGSTAGGAGIKLAYETARKNFIRGGNNRVILCTDGDFNVGTISGEALEILIEKERKSSNIFLTVLGYGMGNYKDKKMQVLAEKGNGNHAYIDNMQEANRVLVNEFGSTIYTVAKDAKLQVEFNPARVQSFRLVGYESRMLEHEDFNDDKKDAGEIGAGHTVTAIYEIVPAGSKSKSGSVDPLKYQNKKRTKKNRDIAEEVYPDELMTVKLRYKDPDGNKSKLMEVAVKERGGEVLSDDFYFASAAAMFAQLLRSSDFKGTATYDDVVTLARKGLGSDEYGYRREMIRLAETARGLDPAEIFVDEAKSMMSK